LPDVVVVPDRTPRWWVPGPPPSLARELAALDRMTTNELRDKFAAVFGETEYDRSPHGLSFRVRGCKSRHQRRPD
jgi:hypothetical protein